MYFITLFEKLDKDADGLPITGCIRTVGYMSTYAAAKELLMKNSGDMHEYMYDYAVIEEIQEGIFTRSTKRTFFIFDSKQRVYTLIDEPACFTNIYNVALG